MICGVSFSGKSTLANAIITRFGYQEIDVDVVGAKLHGFKPGDDYMKDLDWDRIYEEADRQIERLLAAGVTVVDASRNFTREERERARRLATRSNAWLVTIFVDTPVSVARERRLSNRITQVRPDITDEEFEETVHVMQAPTDGEAALVFHHGDEIGPWLQQNSPRLGDQRPI